MFTGIIEGIGKVEKISKNTKNRSAIQMTVNLRKTRKRFEDWTKCSSEWSLSYCNKTF